MKLCPTISITIFVFMGCSRRETAVELQVAKVSCMHLFLRLENLFNNIYNLKIILSDSEVAMTDVNITDLSRNFSDYINRVSYQGERFTILKGKKPVAQISPVPKGKTLADFVAILSESATLTPEEAAAFGADLEDIRNEGNDEMLEDPWASS